jgi:hypothetical protein
MQHRSSQERSPTRLSPRRAPGEPRSSRAGSGVRRDPPPLRRIDSYTLIRELGRGGMGVVYLAEDASGRRVALKVAIGGASTPDRLARLKREGELTAALTHPGIVRIHAAGTTDGGNRYLVFELVEGAQPISDVLPTLDLRERVALLRDAARALGYAHRRGVLHRDVKGDNLLVDATGRVRVADFGLATAQDVERLTQTGGLLGTPSHMSPEQMIAGRSPVGPPTDVWGLGVILYEALTGRLPFEATTLLDLMAAISSSRRTRPRTVDPAIPEGLERICLRALAADPSERYAHGDALADALDAFLAGEERPAKSLALGWWTLGLGLVIAVGLPLLLLDSEPAPRARPQPVPAALDTPSAEPRARPDGRAAGRALERVRLTTVPRRRLVAADAWLAAFPGHEGTAEVARLRRADRLRVPLAELVVAGGRAPRAQAVVLPEGGVLAWGASGIKTREPEFALWRRDGAEEWAPPRRWRAPGLISELAAVSSTLAVAVLDDARVIEIVLGPAPSSRVVWTPPGLAREGLVAAAPDGANGWRACVVARVGPASSAAWELAATAGVVESAPLPSWDSYPVAAVARSPQGGRVVLGGGLGAQAPRPMGTIQLSPGASAVDLRGPVTSVAFSPVGDLVAAGTGFGRLLVYRCSQRLSARRELTRAVEGFDEVGLAHPYPIQALAFGPGGRRLYSVSSNPAETATILQVWTLDDGRLERRVELKGRRLSLSIGEGFLVLSGGHREAILLATDR